MMGLRRSPLTTGQPRLVAEFTSERAFTEALDALSRERYHEIETFAPYDIPEVDAQLGHHRSRIGWLALVGGIAGLVIGYGIQWWANVQDYPLHIGGRPVHAVPAFIPATFEATVLAAALALVFGLAVWVRAPTLWAPIDEIDGFERASIDRFFVALFQFSSGQDLLNAERLLRDAGAVRTVRPATPREKTR
jgi:hypothetical protein